MEENQEQELCRQLGTVNTSLGFLALLILSLCLSWRAADLQREGLCGLLMGRTQELPNVFSLRLPASALVAGALAWFFGLALDTWEGTRQECGAARRSAEVNLWASLFVLAAALLRLYDLVCLQQEEREERETPSADAEGVS